MNNSCHRRSASALVAAAIVSVIPVAAALGGIEVELATIGLHAGATSSDVIGAGTPIDVSYTVTGPGGDGSTYHSISPGPTHPWSSTARYGYTYYETNDAFGYMLAFGGSGVAEAGVSGTMAMGGAGSAGSFSDTVLHLTVGPAQDIHIAGSVSGHSTPGGAGTAYITIRIASGSPGAGTLIWSATATSGVETFGLDLTLPEGGYILHASADALASGGHPVGTFPPGGGDAAYSYAVTLIPAPSCGVFIGALGLCAARRRRM